MLGTAGEWFTQLPGHLFDLVRDHWQKFIGLAIGFIPVLWGVYKAWRQWKTREFMSRFSVSLNILRKEGDGVVLWLPAAEEFELEEVFHRNRTAVRIVRRAAYATTPEQPFLVTIPEDDRMSIMNEVANRVEVMLREGSFAALVGLPVQYVTLVVGLTCEKGADVRIRKIRALVADEALLRNIDIINSVRFDKPHHAVRAQTLRRMAAMYAEKPEHLARITVAMRVAEPLPARDLLLRESVPLASASPPAEVGNESSVVAARKVATSSTSTG